MEWEHQLLPNELFDWRSFYNEYQVPYIIHFVFGLIEQTEPFSFVHYLSIFSAYVANPHVETIYFHHHFEVYGPWWEKVVEDVPCLGIRHIDVPTHIGAKEIKKTAHKADKARMDILWEMGGIYMDIDTISNKPMKPFLMNETTLCKQYSLGLTKNKEPIKYIGGICNAIMVTKPRSKFFAKWMESYEEAFDPDKWEEASIWLPLRLANEYSEDVNILEPEVFNVPGYWEANRMFSEHYFEVPDSLVALHLCESKSKDYIKGITGWEWFLNNKSALYGKMMEPCIEKGLC